MSYKKSIGTVLLGLSLLSLSFFIPFDPKEKSVKAQIALNPLFHPFGGKIIISEPCVIDIFDYGLFLQVQGPPANPTLGGDYIVTYTTILYLWQAGIFIPGNYVLGMAGPEIECFTADEDFRGDAILYMGSSLIPNSFW